MEILLLILLIGNAMVLFAIVLLLLSYSCTMFTLMLHIATRCQNFNLYYKLWTRFLCTMLISCLCPIWPKFPTNLLKFWQVCCEITFNLGCCRYLCVFTTGWTNSNHYPLLPIFSSLDKPTYLFEGLNSLLLSLPLLILVCPTALYH